MNRRNLLFPINIGLIICLLVALPVFSTRAQSQYISSAQAANALKMQEIMLLFKIEEVKSEIINLMGEMIDLMTEESKELTLNFDKFFNLVPETEEESETATSTDTIADDAATTTAEVEETYSYSYGQSYMPEPQAPSIVCDPVAYGRQTYKVSTKSIPIISEFIVDPLDVAFNSSQDVIVNISDTNDNPITSVTGLASTDTGTTPFALSLSSGTETNGTWQGSWVLKDSVCSNFMVTITATSNSGTTKVDVTFR